jgi:hypothetical protein
MNVLYGILVSLMPEKYTLEEHSAATLSLSGNIESIYDFFHSSYPDVMFI